MVAVAQYPKGGEPASEDLRPTLIGIQAEPPDSAAWAKAIGTMIDRGRVAAAMWWLDFADERRPCDHQRTGSGNDCAPEPSGRSMESSGRSSSGARLPP